MGFMGIFFMLSWMFQRDYVDTCFECLICMFCIFVFASVQRKKSIFHTERRSRYTLIIIIIVH